MPLDDLRIISARPTIRLGGQDLPLLTANITRLRMREALGGLSTLELAVVDILSHPDGRAGYGATRESPIRLGAEVKVYMGEVSGPREIFDGHITALEAEVGPAAAPTFTLLAEDRLFKARKTRRTRTFEEMSPADLVRTIAGDHGLTPEIRDGLDAPTGIWVQMNESDLAFLRRILDRFDADLQVVAGALQAGPCARDPRTSVTLSYGGNLIRARLTADLADQATEVRVGGFDPATGEAVNATATTGEKGPGQGQEGPALLRETFQEHREHVGHQGPLTASEGEKVAKAVYGRRARRFVRVDASAQGDAAIRVGSHVAIDGINPFFVNTYVVTEATHRFDLANGYITDFLAEGAFLGEGA
ncbi:MAG: phage late control D family protein [Acetobacteraceae bacterium]